MSLYTQTQAPYGQMVYSAPQGYGHQPMPNYYPPPPPPPQPYYDATYFGRDYMARLSELIVNSRPIIQNLSVIAQDYQRYADTVVQCIETHIRRVSVRFYSPFYTHPWDGAAWIPGSSSACRNDQSS